MPVKVGYVPTAEQVVAQQARRAAQAAEKAARKKLKYGGKTIADPARPGKFISQSAKEVEAAATATKGAKIIDKAKGFLGKVKDLAKKVGKKVAEFSKTKKGKIAIAAAAVLAIAGIIAHNKAENAKNNEEILNMQVKGFENLA